MCIAIYILSLQISKMGPYIIDYLKVHFGDMNFTIGLP